MPPDAVETRRYVVSGRVQGVGFRDFVQARARALGLTGYVRNLPDGRSVEAVAAGPAAALDALAAAIREGPGGSHVATFEAMPAAAIDSEGFTVRH
ncbi:MAG: acylphosphatase [Dehalococcoidia bacterium]|nr:acylphosphatase [Dehalococcoidia bacterium]